MMEENLAILYRILVLVELCGAVLGVRLLDIYSSTLTWFLAECCDALATIPHVIGCLLGILLNAVML